MSEFFCKSCAEKTNESESLTVGILGHKECIVCGRNVDASTEEYSVFRDGAKDRLLKQHKK